MFYILYLYKIATLCFGYCFTLSRSLHELQELVTWSASQPYGGKLVSSKEAYLKSGNSVFVDVRCTPCPEAKSSSTSITSNSILMKCFWIYDKITTWKLFIALISSDCRPELRCECCICAVSTKNPYWWEKWWCNGVDV